MTMILKVDSFLEYLTKYLKLERKGRKWVDWKEKVYTVKDIRYALEDYLYYYPENLPKYIKFSSKDEAKEVFFLSLLCYLIENDDHRELWESIWKKTDKIFPLEDTKNFIVDPYIGLRFPMNIVIWTALEALRRNYKSDYLEFDGWEILYTDGHYKITSPSIAISPSFSLPPVVISVSEPQYDSPYEDGYNALTCAGLHVWFVD